MRSACLQFAPLRLGYRFTYRGVDIILACIGTTGILDGWLCWKVGVPGRGVFRVTCCQPGLDGYDFGVDLSYRTEFTYRTHTA